MDGMVQKHEVTLAGSEPWLPEALGTCYLDLSRVRAVKVFDTMIPPPQVTDSGDFLALKHSSSTLNLFHKEVVGKIYTPLIIIKKRYTTSGTLYDFGMSGIPKNWLI